MNDTKQKDVQNSESFKHEIRSFWEAHPCGSHLSTAMPGSREFFKDFEEFRYAEDGWLLEWIAKQDVREKRLLEIGCGLGAELSRFAEAGARVFAVDMTHTALLLSRRRLELAKLSGSFAQADMQRLPFPDASFDVIFSFGVIHHTPRIDQTLAEIFRILRPGGKVLIGIYNKKSLHYYWNIRFLNGVLKGKSLHKHLRTVIAEGTDGYGNPWSTVYTRKQVHILFKDFLDVSVFVRGLSHRSFWARLGKYVHPTKLPRWFKAFLDYWGKRVGWYLLVEGVKPGRIPD